MKKIVILLVVCSAIGFSSCKKRMTCPTYTKAKTVETEKIQKERN